MSATRESVLQKLLDNIEIQAQSSDWQRLDALVRAYSILWSCVGAPFELRSKPMGLDSGPALREEA